MCHSVTRDRPRAPPQLSRHPTEQGRQCTRHFSYRPVAVGDNVPVASMASSF